MNSQQTNPLQKSFRLPVCSKPVAVLLTALALLLSSITPLLAKNDLLALCSVALLTVYTAVMTRSAKSVLTVVLLALFPQTFFEGSFGSAFLVSAAVGICAGAYLITLCRTPIYSALISALCYGVCSWILGSFTGDSLLTLLIFPAYLLFSFAVFRRERRSVAVLFGQLGLIGFAVLLLSLFLKAQYGAVSPESFRAFVAELRSELLLSAQLFREQAAELSAEDAALAEAVNRVFSDETVQSTVLHVTNLLPAMLAVGCGILAFFGGSLYLAMGRASKDEYAANPQSRFFVLGIPSAVVYLAATLLTFLLDGGSIAYTVAESVGLILLPGFFLSGLQRLLGLFSVSARNGKWFFLLLIFFLLCCLSVGAVELLAFWAAVDTLLFPLRKRRFSRRNE